MTRWRSVEPSRTASIRQACCCASRCLISSCRVPSVRRFGSLLLGLDGEAVKRLVRHRVGNATFQISWHMRLVANLYYVNLRADGAHRDSWMPVSIGHHTTAALAALP